MKYLPGLNTPKCYENATQAEHLATVASTVGFDLLLELCSVFDLKLGIDDKLFVNLEEDLLSFEGGIAIDNKVIEEMNFTINRLNGKTEVRIRVYGEIKAQSQTDLPDHRGVLRCKLCLPGGFLL